MTKKTANAPKTNKAKSTRKVGRPCTYTPETLEAKFREYRNHIAETPIYKEVPAKGGPMDIRVNRPATLVGFCVFAGIGRNTFLDYEERPEFSNVVARVRETIETDQLEGAMAGVYDSSIVSRVLRLADRQDVTTNGKEITQAPAVTFTVDEAAASIIQSIGKQTINSVQKDGD